MILGGDEIGRSQQGNNNAYCQDNELSWFDWAGADFELRTFTRELLRIRREHSALRPKWFRHDSDSNAENSVDFYRADGAKLDEEDWEDGTALSMLVRMTAPDDDTTFAWLVNSSSGPVDFTLPEGKWAQYLSSDPDQAYESEGPTILIREHSFTLLAAED